MTALATARKELNGARPTAVNLSWATGILFGAQVAAQAVPSALFAVAFLCISVATPMIRNLLIPGGRFRTVFAATIAAADAYFASLKV